MANRDSIKKCVCKGKLMRDKFYSEDDKQQSILDSHFDEVKLPTGKEDIGGYTKVGRAEYDKIQYKQEYEKEKRSRELLRRGYNTEAVHLMMKLDRSYINKLKNTRGRITLDGRL